jgi:hypothetical protein
VLRSAGVGVQLMRASDALVADFASDEVCCFPDKHAERRRITIHGIDFLMISALNEGVIYGTNVPMFWQKVNPIFMGAVFL